MDSRFDTSSWSTQDSKAGPSSKPYPSDRAEDDLEVGKHDLSNQEEDFDHEELDLEDEEEEDGEEEEEQKEGSTPKKRKRLLSPSNDPSCSKKKRSKGIIYISRIPPGMTPPKVRHLLEGFGDVERLYLQDGREKERKRGNEGRDDETKSRSAHYTEGWVEFSSKKIAKLVASSLNAQPIGIIGGAGTGRKGKGSRGIKGREKSRWKDDIWTMKYLSGYRWEMLSSQLANERASHAARLRNELSQDAFEQKDYLKKVERARVEGEKAEKKRKRNEKSGLASSNNDDDPEKDTSRMKKSFTFKQRAPILKDVRDQGGVGGNAGSLAPPPSSSSSSGGKVEVGNGTGSKRKRESDSTSRKSRELKGGMGIDAKKELSGVLSKIF